MEIVVCNLTGAPYGEKSPTQVVQRYGHRERDWHTRTGTVSCASPSCAKAATFRAFWNHAGWRIASVAVIVAVGVNSDRRREVLGWTSVHPKPSPSGQPSCASLHAGAIPSYTTHLGHHRIRASLLARLNCDAKLLLSGGSE